MGAYENPRIIIDRSAEVWGQVAENIGSQVSQWAKYKKEKEEKDKLRQERDAQLEVDVNLASLRSEKEGYNKIDPLLRVGEINTEILNAGEAMKNANLQLRTNAVNMTQEEKDNAYNAISNFDDTVNKYSGVGTYVQGVLGYIQSEENGTFGTDWTFVSASPNTANEDYIWWTSMSGTNNDYSRETVKNKDGKIEIRFKNKSGEVVASKTVDELNAMALNKTRATAKIPKQNVIATNLLNDINITTDGVFNAALLDASKQTSTKMEDGKRTFETQYLSDDAQKKIDAKIRAQAAADLSGTPEEIQYNLKTLWNYTFRNGSTMPFEEWYANKDINHLEELVREYKEAAGGVMKLAIDENGNFYKSGGVKDIVKRSSSRSSSKRPKITTEVGQLKTEFGYGQSTAENIVQGMVPYNETIAEMDEISTAEDLMDLLNSKDPVNSYVGGRELLILAGKLSQEDTNEAAQRVANENSVDLDAVYNTKNPRKPYKPTDFKLIQSLLFKLNDGTSSQLKAIKGHLNTLKRREEAKKKDWIDNYKANNPDVTDSDALIAYKLENKNN